MEDQRIKALFERRDEEYNREKERLKRNGLYVYGLGYPNPTLKEIDKRYEKEFNELIKELKAAR